MNKINLLLLLFISFTELCDSQSFKADSIEINCTTSEYYINNRYITVLKYLCTNRSYQKVWLWFSDENSFNLTDEEKIKKYFLSKKPNSDWSLFEIGNDPNIESFHPNTANSFIKRFDANHSFAIYLMVNKQLKKVEKQKYFSCINKIVRVFREQEMINAIPNINKLLDFIFYKYDFIIFDMKDFKRWQRIN
jgi:hypothetical protein